MGRNKKYVAREDIFDKDSETSMYLAGFIAADGCVLDTNRLQVSLSIKDADFLIKILGIICCKHDGPRFGPNNSIGFSVASKDLCRQLERFNIFPRKSLVYTFPEWLVSNKMVNHFMRGYSDGDGSFYGNYTKKTPQLRYSLRGTESFLSSFEDIIVKNCNINKKKRMPISSGYSHLQYAGKNKVFMIRDFLYKDASIFLDRKRNIAYNSDFVYVGKEHRRVCVIGTNIKTKEELFFNSMTEATNYGFVYQGISACCRGKNKTHRGYTWKYA